MEAPEEGHQRQLVYRQEGQVREEGVLDLATAIYKCTGLPASRAKFKERGLLIPGYAADITGREELKYRIGTFRHHFLIGRHAELLTIFWMNGKSSLESVPGSAFRLSKRTGYPDRACFSIEDRYGIAVLRIVEYYLSQFAFLLHPLECTLVKPSVIKCEYSFAESARFHIT